MAQKAFSFIVQKVESVLSSRGFARVNSKKTELKEVFINKNVAYEVLYDSSEKKFKLSVCSIEEEASSKNWQLISAWLFDPSDDGIKQTQSIAADFVETIGQSKQNHLKSGKKRKKDEEGNVNPLFFVNRLSNIFPELKEEIRREVKLYGDLRGATFTLQNVVPKIVALLGAYSEKERVKKLGTLLDNLYKSGDLDVKGIITIIILNSIETENLENTLRENLGDELKKAWDAAKKLKGKKIKPEKVKKRRIYS
ncbi:MAG: hypothetical protein LBJ95_01825 [Oscillospiraceae bacterium]|nr:hypothetical protein [Oscillospiraceae bacterium]